MKFKQLLFLVLVVIKSLEVCAQSVDKNGKLIPAITTATQDGLDAKADVLMGNLSNPSTARANLGLAIGIDVQAYDAGLADLADGILSANKVENAITTAGTSGQVWTSDGIGAGIWKLPANSIIEVGVGLVISGTGTATTPFTISLPIGGTIGQVLTIGSGGIPIWTDAATGTIFYEDADADGYGNNNSPFVAVSAPIGYVSDNTDCNDTDVNEYPRQRWYLDADADGYGGGSEVSCTRPSSGFLLSELTGTGTDDCDDNAATINPATVWYMDVDGDDYGGASKLSCTRPVNGFLLSELVGTDDCNDDAVTINPTTVWYIDKDRDGYGISSKISCTRPSSGFLLSELTGTGTDDCNDTDANEYPAQRWYIDADGDDYGVSSQVTCTRPANGFLLSDLTGIGTDDCDDNDAAINPATVWYIDGDGDGYGGGSEVSCTRPTNGFLLSELTGTGTDDCNDNAASINPGATEPVDGVDNNCSGQIDEAVIGSFRDGGIVFWIDSLDNNHGLVCAVVDQGIGINWNDGLSLVTLYGGGGYNDWRLPSKDELNQLYRYKTIINITAGANGGGAFFDNRGTQFYWSSTVGANPWVQFFSSGLQSDSYPSTHTIGRVRAIRAF